MPKMRSVDLAKRSTKGPENSEAPATDASGVKSSLQRMTTSLQGKTSLSLRERFKLGMKKQGVQGTRVHELDEVKVSKVRVDLKATPSEPAVAVDFVLPAPESTANAVRSPIKVTIEPVIYLCDNLLRVNKFIDLNACKLSTANDENSIPFSVEVCTKLHEGRVQFYVESVFNPLEQILSVQHDESDAPKLKRYVPDYFEDEVFDVKVKSLETGKVRYLKVCFEELIDMNGSKKTKLLQVCGKLTQGQIDKLGLRPKVGPHFSYYEK